ncbi:MAG TPA: IPT/TIG domain-containing protein, partial [Thermoanaerobaculia bacterium]|nr:IPT/TIG domain-containing protein [Thermoanaerobaculia bacterium]
AAATHFVISAPATATSGAAFSLTITAFDASNNIATGYAGTIHFTSTDAAATLPADSTLTNGSGSFSATLRTAGSQTITATDGTITATSGAVVVQSAAAAHFAIAAPAATGSGNAFSFSVTALDSSNNIVTNYSGTIHFTSSDALATLPANTTLTNGTGTFSATLGTAGNQTITATDIANAAITGTSAAIAVTAAAPSLTALSTTVGLTTGGTSVTISGANLSGATSVTFGGVAAVITSQTSTSIVVSAPPHAAGPVDVVVTTAGGTATLPHAFTYVADIPALSFSMLLLLAMALTITAAVRLGGE